MEPLWIYWINANVRIVCGQTDDEFDQLVDAFMDEFYLGVDEFVRSVQGPHNSLARTTQED
ncbi:hypothetical protein BN2475_710072 [Paraburkholderia ribeironis]|uniref:Uncharacterized protein n=1 Tax=Paraburkholderia ribeironis TaxID=1247936 RepID=A0A1N7SIB4_9BURK|nr:hypothetical protein BN2475_710072 [Paraburkholderia ribeironis]